MLKNSVIDSLCQHLTENHDEDWRFEYIEHDGLALNCYLPTDSSDTYVIVDATQYEILEHGKNVPQGLIDEIATVILDAYHLQVNWEYTDNPEKWA